LDGVVESAAAFWEEANCDGEKPGWLMAGWRRMGLGAVVRVVTSEATTPTERSGVLAWREIGEKARERSSRLIVSRHFHPR
jgi:hypothetical protein